MNDILSCRSNTVYSLIDITACDMQHQHGIKTSWHTHHIVKD